MITPENGMRKDEIYAMWQRNFHDPVSYANFYFEEVYGKNEILLNTEKDDSIKGMLHLNPYNLRMSGETKEAHYIVGVATEEEFRRQGVMRELLEETFLKLRGQGEAFTYLMPADENYYLPFDFRFGSAQIEQEIECFTSVLSEETEKKYEYVTLEKVNLSNVSQIENQKKDELFKIHTEISPEYLLRLEKEISSEFGKLLFVYSDGNYIGRFVVGAENDYMVVSQIFCTDQEMRQRFLYEILNYCENAYHYGKYQLILDESWQGILKKAGNYQGIRVLPSKFRPIIMFRILNLDNFGTYLNAKEEDHGFLQVSDYSLKEQSGTYEWILSKERCEIRKWEDFEGEADCGKISMGDLTAVLFGNRKEEVLAELSGLTPKGRKLLSLIEPIGINCIQEIV